MKREFASGEKLRLVTFRERLLWEGKQSVIGCMEMAEEMGSQKLEQRKKDVINIFRILTLHSFQVGNFGIDHEMYPHQVSLHT